MKKVIIFLNSMFTHWFDFYHFDEVGDRSEFEFIAIIGNKHSKRFSEAAKKHFDRIVECDNNNSEDQLLESIDPDQVGIVVKEIVDQYGRENVYLLSIDEGSIQPAAILREKYQLTGMKMEIARLTRNKYLMKRFLEAKNIRVAKGVDINLTDAKKSTSKYYKKLTEQLGSTFIIKPTSSAGCADVEKISNEDKFRAYIEKIEVDLQYLAEEFIDGEMFASNLVLYNQKILCALVEGYSKPLMRIKFGEDVGVISLLEGKNCNSVKLFGKQVMAALNKPNGTYHIEVFLTSNNEMIFNELNARIPGALCVPCLQDCLGVNLLDMELFSILGQACLPRAIKEYSCYFVLARRDGVVERLNEPNFDSRVEFDWSVKPGDQLTISDGLVSNAGLLRLYNDDYNMLKKDYLKMNSFEALTMAKPKK